MWQQVWKSRLLGVEALFTGSCAWVAALGLKKATWSFWSLTRAPLPTEV
jgi:hypothetical protein